MPPPSAETINAIQRLIGQLASNNLPRSLARLYSHHTRLRENRPGLTSWGRQETLERLHDVMRLVEASSVQREASENENEWQQPMRRAGEILEWLSLVGDAPGEVPIHLLSAAAYQIAGYPARATGLLNTNDRNRSQSQILESFLKADFPLMFSQIANFWEEQLETILYSDANAAADLADALPRVVANETISALGVLCSYIRWGNEDRLQRAMVKLDAVQDVLLHGQNPYSWLLGKLCGEVGRGYIRSHLRGHLRILLSEVNETGQQILERYYRLKYQNKQALAWPSQTMGIAQLAGGQSFALCTPTGSGKTTVAELAILQGLFVDADAGENAPLVVYIVPSKALATEVESKLSKVLRNVSQQEITVTGLYGGTDWGPTDAWLTNNERTVLICTFEKAEALVRFLGISFLQRISLVVIDEAHGVQFGESVQKLQKAESRALRLEFLTSRLFAHLRREGRHGRVIALSAVAAGIEQAISQWATQGSEAAPIRTPYRSTRQLIGRLECLEGRGYEIQYDILDGVRLEVQRMGRADRPYIPNPFTTHPGGPASFEEANTIGPRLRPYLLWAAMHLAAPDEQGRRRAVLISVTQKISAYAGSFLQLLRSRAWQRIELPRFFIPPTAGEEARLWQRCLNSCADYFTTSSREYCLLELGIVVHHGNMPGLLARLLVEAIDAKIVTLVIATSTLSEGVNLPFETVLIPDLERWDESSNSRRSLDSREFSNLVGRAGRPGFGTEGRSLVLLLRSNVGGARRARQSYQLLLNQLTSQQEGIEPQSPLAQLIRLLSYQWRQLTGQTSLTAFNNWLEQAEPCTTLTSNELEQNAIESLDTLDSLLLTAIYEIEQATEQELSPDEMETELRRIWQNTYARYADLQQGAMEEAYIRRGRSLRERIYPDSTRRRRLYRTSIPPRSGSRLLEIESDLRQHLLLGMEYSSWTDEQKFIFIRDSMRFLEDIPVFTPETERRISWVDQLRWWLFHNRSSVQPSNTQVANWHKSVNRNFIYKFNWGFGGVVALAIDEAFGGRVLEPHLEDWPLTGLPWIVFWMKEIITWGTLEPVAAYLLARIDEVITRAQAEAFAAQYDAEMGNEEINEHLNAIRIRDWAQRTFPAQLRNEDTLRPSAQIPVLLLLRDFSLFPARDWQVIPVESSTEIIWLDPAGFPLATSARPENWQSNFLKRWDFKLDPDERVVISSRYL